MKSRKGDGFQDPEAENIILIKIFFSTTFFAHSKQQKTFHR